MSRTILVSHALPAFVVLCCAAACLPKVLAAEPAEGERDLTLVESADADPFSPFSVNPAEGDRASAVSVIKHDASSTRARTEAALLEPTPPLEFIDTPLNQVVEYISDARDIQIILDDKALIDAGIGTDAPITTNLRDFQLRTALKVVTREHDLTYVFFDDVLLITTREAALGMLETRVYPVGDLLTAGADAKTLATELNHLAEIVSTSLASSTWSGLRGAGHVESLPTQRALVVSQTTEAHEKVEQVLAMIRRVPAPTKGEVRASGDTSEEPSDRMSMFARMLFNRYDQNQDGVVSGAELDDLGGRFSLSELVEDGVVTFERFHRRVNQGNTSGR